MGVRIAIVGAGSLGLLFAGTLAAHGYHVTLAVHTAAQVRDIRALGVKVEDGGRSMLSHPRLVRGLSGLEEADWIFLMVKQTHMDDAFVDKLSRRISASARLLCFQNGIGHVQKLSRLISSERIFIAVTTEAARKISHTGVIHTGSGRIWIGREGEALNEADEPVTSLLKMLNLAGFKAFASKTMESVVWNKLIINSVINPLTAILRLKNGELLSSASWQSLMRTLMEEALTVARLTGVNPSDDLWEQLHEVCRQTAENQSSMLQDMLHGRNSEIDWINGSLIRLASVHGIELSAHKVIYQMVKGFEGSQ